MGTDVPELVAALRRSHDRLIEVVRPLTPEDLRGQSYDREWTIAQVLSHLGSGAEIALRSFDAQAAGGELEGPGAPAIWDRWNAMSAEQQAANSLLIDGEYTVRLEGATPEEFDRMHAHFLGRDFGASDLLALRLSEHVLHTWDIAVALDSSARVPSDAIPLLQSLLFWWVARLCKPEGRHMLVRVRTTDPDRDYILNIADAVSLGQYSDQPYEVELRLPGEAFLRLLYGRLDPDHTPPDVEITGDASLDELRGMFPGI